MVDLTCMRDAMKELGSDPNKINPLVCKLSIIMLFFFFFILSTNEFHLLGF